MTTAKPHFIRCLKPNKSKVCYKPVLLVLLTCLQSPNVFDHKYVSQQVSMLN